MRTIKLEQLFGSGASQDNQYLVIQKVALIKLTPLAENRAEQLFVALLLQAQQIFEGTLTAPNEEILLDSRNRTVSYNHSDLYEKLAITFWQRQFDRSYFLDTFLVEIYQPSTQLFGQPINLGNL